MRCRIAGFIGCAPSEVDDMPAPDVQLLIRYWNDEPWGAWRSNIHAAIIAREIARLPWTLWGKTPPAMNSFERWMVIDPERRRQGHVQGFRNMLIGMAGGIRKHISELPKRSRKRKRKGNA